MGERFLVHVYLDNWRKVRAITGSNPGIAEETELAVLEPQASDGVVYGPSSPL